MSRDGSSTPATSKTDFLRTVNGWKEFTIFLKNNNILDAAVFPDSSLKREKI